MSIRGLEPGTRAALLISECQRGVVEVGRSPFETLAEQVAERGIVERIARLADAFRAAGQPVMHLHVAHRPDYSDVPRTSLIIARAVKAAYMNTDSVDVDPMPALAPQPGDHVQARRFSLGAFNGTDLDATLRHLGVRTLVLCGVSSNVAINNTALTGSDLGYQVLVAEDCSAGASAETHAFMVRNLLPLYATVTTQAEIEAALRASAS